MTQRTISPAVLAAGLMIAGCAGEAALLAEELLPAASAYDAVARHDVDALAAAFEEGGVVIDVRRRIAGRDAIGEWRGGR